MIVKIKKCGQKDRLAVVFEQCSDCSDLAHIRETILTLLSFVSQEYTVSQEELYYITLLLRAFSFSDGQFEKVFDNYFTDTKKAEEIQCTLIA